MRNMCLLVRWQAIEANGFGLGEVAEPDAK